MSTYEERQAYRDSHPGVVVDATSSSDGGFDGGSSSSSSSSSSSDSSSSSAPQYTAPSSSGGNLSAPSGSYNTINGIQTTATMASQLVAHGWAGNTADPAAVAAAYASTTGGAVTAGSGGGDSGGGGGGGGGGGSTPAPSASGGLQQLLDALASGNAAAAAEATRQFNATFGLDQQKFNESVSEYNQNFGLAQTKQAADIAAQVAGLTGTYNGAPTEAAKEASNKTAVDVLNLASSLHADPFRQLQVMYGANNIDGVNKAVQGLTGQYGLASGQYTAPGTSANLGGLVQSYNNAGSGLSPSQQAANTGLTNPNQIIAREFNNAPQNVQDFTTSALSANTGLDQSTLTKQIQDNLPKFNAPSFGLATV